MKKLLAIILTIATLFTLATPAFATAGGTPQIAEESVKDKLYDGLVAFVGIVLSPFVLAKEAFIEIIDSLNYLGTAGFVHTIGYGFLLSDFFLGGLI